MIDQENYLDLVEARFHELGRRIAEFDPFKDSVKKLELCIKNLTQDIQNFLLSQKPEKEIRKKTDDEFDRLISNLEIKRLDFSSKYDSYKSELDNKLEYLEDRIKDISKLYLKNKDLEDKISNLVLLKDKSISVSEDLNKELQKQKNQIQDLFKENIYLKSELLKTKSDIDSLCVKNAENEVATDKLFDAIRESKDSTEVKISEIKSTCSCNISKLTKSFEDKLSSIVIPDISNLAEKLSIEKLSRNIELASLDAKNAFAKSNNSEMQNQLFSKKLDSMQILLKSREYSNEK